MITTGGLFSRGRDRYHHLRHCELYRLRCCRDLSSQVSRSWGSQILRESSCCGPRAHAAQVYRGKAFSRESGHGALDQQHLRHAGDCREPGDHVWRKPSGRVWSAWHARDRTCLCSCWARVQGACSSAAYLAVNSDPGFRGQGVSHLRNCRCVLHFL